MYVLQQKIPQACTPKWMLGSKGEVTLVCAGPCEKPFSHDYYTESGSDDCVKIKAWLKISEEAKTWRQIVLYPLSWIIWTSFLGLFPFTFACLIRSYIFSRSEFEELCPIYI